MKRRDLVARRERNRELGAIDAAHRCAYCRRQLPAVPVQRFTDSSKFCSEACFESDEARLKAVQG